jgi:hypothetical protein
MDSTSHLWNFMTQTLSYESFRKDALIFGLSTDLETATDFANPHVARGLLDEIIEFFKDKPEFPSHIFRVV